MKPSLLLGVAAVGVALWLLTKDKPAAKPQNFSSDGVATKDTSTAAVYDLLNRVFPPAGRLQQPGGGNQDILVAGINAGSKLATAALEKVVNAGGGNSAGTNPGYNTSNANPTVMVASASDFQGYLYEYDQAASMDQPEPYSGQFQRDFALES
jgi:hypothetical protein